MRLLCTAIGFCAAQLAWAQADDIARSALLQRQQQSDAFTLQLQQSQQRLGVPAAQQKDLELQQMIERRQFDATVTQQQSDLRTQQSIAGPETQRSASWGPSLNVVPWQMQRERDTEIDRARISGNEKGASPSPSPSLREGSPNIVPVE